MMQNLRGAYLILEAIKRDGKNACKTAVPSGNLLDIISKIVLFYIFCAITKVRLQSIS